MDEDAKTLLAILALVYGSSNGIGLLKTAIEPVQNQADALRKEIEDPRADKTYLANNRKKLFRALLSAEVLLYALLVVLLPLFLVLVLWFGARNALALIGLGIGGPASSAARGSLFYWILLMLSLLSSTHLLSPYFNGWRVFAKSRSRSKS